MMPIHPLEYTAATHPGLKRDNNEDCFLALPDAGLWVVADGMGGHEAGEVASAIVRDIFAKNAEESAHFSLTETIQQAHQTILKSAADGIGALGMGSTVVALYSQKKHFQIAWVGDSRAYLWITDQHGGQLIRLTTDHSYVQMLFTTGAINAEELETHPDKNIITQCLGMQELTELNVDTIQKQWQRNQWVLLCSDGLTDELSDSEIAAVLARSQDSLTAVNDLLNTALNKGGSDNITLQIIESPLCKTLERKNYWNWIPPISSNRTLDIIIFTSAIVALLGLLIATLK